MRQKRSSLSDRTPAPLRLENRAYFRKTAGLLQAPYRRLLGSAAGHIHRSLVSRQATQLPSGPVHLLLGYGDLETRARYFHLRQGNSPAILDTRPLLLSEMGAVLFVLRADVLQNVAIRYQYLDCLYGEGLGVHFGIVDGQLQVHMAKIAPVEALLNPQSLAMRMAERIEPASVVESGRIDHQRIAFPTSYRVAQPGRFRIGG